MWTVSIFVASLPGARRSTQSVVVEVDVERDTPQKAITDVGTPRIVRMILEAVGASDGAAPIEAQPTVVASGDIEQVFQAITDHERTVSVVIAASPSRSLDSSWRNVIESLTKESVGVASVFVVQADAVPELQRSLPASHTVEAGRVRTFLPKVDLDDPADGTRHMRLGPATLRRSLNGTYVARPLQARHAESSRRRLIELEPPADIRRNLDILRRAEMAVIREAEVETRLAESTSKSRSLTASTRPSSTSDTSGIAVSLEGVVSRTTHTGWMRATDTLRRWLGTVEPEPESFDQLDRFIEKTALEGVVARDQLTESLDKLLNLESELGELRSRIDDLEIDIAQAEHDSVSQQDELATLRQRLAVSAKPQDAYIEPTNDEWKAPDSVEELLSRITPGENGHPVLSRVEFTGIEEPALEIDRRYVLGTYATSLWQFIRVLHDYAEARISENLPGSLHMYLSDERVAGTKCSPLRHASRESDTVLNNPKWRAERIFPVPASVNPDGLVLMDAHFKPTHRDTFAPRLHYFDDVSSSGKIYIGYIGRHLKNTKS